jgi:hypothetical protein
VALDERTTELALRNVRELTAEVKRLTAEMVKTGRDPQPMLADVQRRLNQAQELPRPTSYTGNRTRLGLVLPGAFWPMRRWPRR